MPRLEEKKRCRNVLGIGQLSEFLDAIASHALVMSVSALWFNRGMGSEIGVAQLLALKVFSSTTLEF